MQLFALVGLGQSLAAEPYNHPLVQPIPDDVLDSVGDLATGSDILPRIEVFHSRGEDADGTTWDDAGYRLPDVEVFRKEPSVEGERGPAFQGGAVARLLGGPYALGKAPVLVNVSLTDADIDDVPHMQVDRMRAMLDGEVFTEDEAQAFRGEWVQRRARASSKALDEITAFVASTGGEVLAEDVVSAVATVLVPEWALRDLVEFPIVSAVDEPTEDVADAGYGWTVTGTSITGYELEDLIQSEQYYDDTYWAFGETIGIMEEAANNIYIAHPGFNDVWGNGRVENCTWSAGACTSSSPSTGGSHSTAVASIAVGSLTEAQDSAYISNTGTNWRDRSGVARMADAVGSNDMNYFLSSSFPGALVNRSSHVTTDPACTGADSTSHVANTLYESGVALIKSASNTGHSSSTNCTVGSPGSAIGAFTVAAMFVNGSNNEEIYDGSSRGGTSSEGRGRSIIAITTPSLMEYPYPFSDALLSSLRYGTDWADTLDPGPETFCCTSAATPVASGAAALFRDWYLDNIDSSIDDPGFLYANMLLMGDRTQESGSRLTTGYDGLWGAGKLRLREFSEAGMDGPWGWGDGSVCVADGTYSFVTISSSALSSDVDVMRVVSWWYDRRHDDSSSTAIDHVSMQVRRYDSWAVPVVPNSGTMVAEDASSDNKLRLHIDNPTSGKEYRIRFSGDDVTSDGEGCGTNSMRVYYAWFYEDSDREAGEALPYIRPE